MTIMVTLQTYMFSVIPYLPLCLFVVNPRHVQLSVHVEQVIIVPSDDWSTERT
jgi:hypothetical protein